jgi:hypothetical protein
MLIYILIALVLGFVPGIAYGLILVESYMIFDIAHGYGVDSTGEIVFFCFKAGVVSAVLKTVAHAIHLVPIIGQVANSLVAAVFVFGLYNVADSHYQHLARHNLHPDSIPQVPLYQRPTK